MEEVSYLIIYEEEISSLELEADLECRSSKDAKVMAVCRQVAQTFLRSQC